MQQPRALLLSAYDAGSHKQWRERLRLSLPEFNWTTLALPPRHFQWRIRGNPLSWWSEAAFQEDYDLCVATSMVDLAALIGIQPQLRQVPTLLYFHENQFAYPSSANMTREQVLAPQIVQLYSSLAADILVFNSRYNLKSFVAGVVELLAKLPDAKPVGLLEALEAKSSVLPVPLGGASQSPRASLSEAPVIVWNHRWEYDKGPENLLGFIQSLPPSQDLKFHILGQSFREKPSVFKEIEETLRARGWLGEWGYIPCDKTYRDLLGTSDIVLSTAKHDFQGLSVLEGMAAGCWPLVPDDLAYPEWVPSECRYRSEVPGRVGAEAYKTFTRLKMRTTPPHGLDLSDLSLESLIPRYRSLLMNLMR